MSQSASINWRRVITDLVYAGYSCSAIAVTVGVSKSAVRGWRDGSTPRYDDGEALIDLWERVTGNGRDSVPRLRR